MKRTGTTITKYVEVEVEVEVNIDLDADELSEIGSDVLLALAAKKGICTIAPCLSKAVDTAYYALTPTTPEPIRELALELAGRIA